MQATGDSARAFRHLGGVALACAVGCGPAAPATAPAPAPPRVSTPAAAPAAPAAVRARHVILCIADGWGWPQIAATRAYTGRDAPYAGWTCRAMATWDLDTQRGNDGTGYDPAKAWSDFTYPATFAPDSASTATAMMTGVKTDSGNISVGHGDRERLRTISEIALASGLASGALTTVPIAHATPGCWTSHNDARQNGYAIAAEALFGDPVATGSATTAGYAGSHGPTPQRPQVVIGGGHPGFSRNPYVNDAILARLRGGTGAGNTDGWTLVERIAGRRDAGARLLAAAADPAVTRLVGLFGGADQNIEFRGPDGSGHDPENPTLAAMARAALAVLGRNARGFVLLIEGGAVDWGCHANRLDLAVGELRGFDAAVQAVIDWVDDPASGATWDDTLVIVTGDHECGFLTPGPGVFPDRPLGEVSDRTFALERLVAGSERRASWDDTDGDGAIDPGERVHWAFATGFHSNSLIPLFARGRGASRLGAAPAGTDPVRGVWVENTAVFDTMRFVVEEP